MAWNPVDVLLVAAVLYLIYKVNRLERLLEGRSSARRAPARSGDGKVIPILKDQIEPGPFKKGNEQHPPESEE